MSKGITISKKHGLNPSVVVCPVCGKEHSIILFGKIKGDAKAPFKVQGDLCDDCKKTNVRIIEVNSEADKTPTGRYIYVPKDALNVDCPKGIALMSKDEFNKYFC